MPLAAVPLPIRPAPGPLSYILHITFLKRELDRLCPPAHVRMISFNLGSSRVADTTAHTNMGVHWLGKQFVVQAVCIPPIFVRHLQRVWSVFSEPRSPGLRVGRGMYGRLNTVGFRTNDNNLRIHRSAVYQLANLVRPISLHLCALWEAWLAFSINLFCRAEGGQMDTSGRYPKNDSDFPWLCVFSFGYIYTPSLWTTLCGPLENHWIRAVLSWPLDPVKKGQVNASQSERTGQSIVVDQVNITRFASASFTT